MLNRQKFPFSYKTARTLKSGDHFNCVTLVESYSFKLVVYLCEISNEPYSSGLL